MRRCLSLCSALALAACAKSGTPAADTTKPAMQQAAPAAQPLSLAQMAGKWNVASKPTTGTDTTTSHMVIAATADTTGWTVTYPKGKPIAMHVKPDADSLIIDLGPYESPRAPGRKVTVHSIARLQDGKLIATTYAHYATAKGDSVVTLHTEGTRAP